MTVPADLQRRVFAGAVGKLLRDARRGPKRRDENQSVIARHYYLCQRVFAEPDTLGNFRDSVRSLRNLVLQLDAGGKLILLLPHQREDLLDRRLALPPRQIGSAARSLFAVLQVYTRD